MSLRWALPAFILTLAGCVGERRGPPAPATTPSEARQLIDAALPKIVRDRAGWVTDLYAGFSVLEVMPSRENVCAVIAVIAQESGFQVDPVIPGLPAIAWREIDDRAGQVGVPRLVVHSVLQLSSPDGRTYADRIDHARTEKELSDTYEDLIGTVPLGRTLFEDHNPIRTRGPMQVHVAFAERFAVKRRYPYPVKRSIADEVFTRRGGLYFGIAHLLAYAAPYDRYLYRFADFNAGQYASRNAAFQKALSTVSGLPLAADGALLPKEADAKGPGATELAARAAEARLRMDGAAIRDALDKGKSADFGQTVLYQRVFALAEQSERHPVSRAIVPRIELHGPKISRKLTTDWYANRVNDRYESCVKR